MQTFFLVADDIMDGAETRRGKQCWYKKDSIGMMAFNDAIILETCIYSVLSRHLKHHRHYNTFVDAFLQVNLNNALTKKTTFIAIDFNSTNIVFLDNTAHNHWTITGYAISGESK